MRSVENFKIMNHYEDSFIDSQSTKKKWISFIYRYTYNKRLSAKLENDVLIVRVMSKKIERPWRYRTGSFYVSFD